MSRDTPDDDLDMQQISAATGDGPLTFEWTILDELGFDPMNSDPVAGYMVVEICTELNHLLRDTMSEKRYIKLKRIFVNMIEPATRWYKIHKYIIPLFQKIFPTLLSFQNFIKTNYLGTIEEFKSTPKRPHIGHQRIEIIWRLITDNMLNINDLPIDAHLNPYTV